MAKSGVLELRKQLTEAEAKTKEQIGLVLELVQKLDAMTRDRDHYKARAHEVSLSPNGRSMCLVCRAPLAVAADDMANRVRELRAAHEKASAERATAKERGYFEGLSKALRVLACCMKCEASSAEIPE